MTALNVILTVVIAGAAAVQGFFAWRLWSLQDSIEKQRARTYVSAMLEYIQIDSKLPGYVYLRLENASGVGVMARMAKLVVTAKGRKEGSIALNFALGPYSVRTKDITDEFRNLVWDANPGAPPVNENQHSAEAELAATYETEGRQRTSTPMKFRATYARWNCERIEIIA